MPTEKRIGLLTDKILNLNVLEEMIPIKKYRVSLDAADGGGCDIDNGGYSAFIGDEPVVVQLEKIDSPGEYILEVADEEKRDYARYPYIKGMKYRIKGEREWIVGVCKNISEGGVCIKNKNKILPGTEIEINISTLHLKGIVCHTVKSTAERSVNIYETGVLFNTTAAQKKGICGFIYSQVDNA